jgi:hypothetical protein
MLLGRAKLLGIPEGVVAQAVQVLLQPQVMLLVAASNPPA